MKQYNQILRELREDKDETQKDIADLLGINQRVYSRYETGKNLMPITYLKPLCEHFRVSADYVLGVEIKNKKRG